MGYFMKKIKNAVAGAVIIGIFIYVFNFEYFGHFLSLICNSAMECVTGGDEYSNQLAKEMDTLKVSKFISLKVNGKEIDLDNTDFGEDFYHDIVDKMTDSDMTTEGEEESGESGSSPGIVKMNLEDLPQNVQDAFKKYDDAGWQGNVPGQTKGTKAGKLYLNSDRSLPAVDGNGNPITYKEWDVNNKQPGQCRDGERFITGSDGSIYYTDSHYGEGESLNGFPAFIKIR